MKKHPNPWLDAYWQQEKVVSHGRGFHETNRQILLMGETKEPQYILRAMIVIVLFVTGVGFVMSMTL